MTQMPAETTYLKHVKDLSQIEKSENMAFIFIDNCRYFYVEPKFENENSCLLQGRNVLVSVYSPKHGTALMKCNFKKG